MAAPDAASAERVEVARSGPGTLALRGALTFATAARALAEGTRLVGEQPPTRLDLAGLTRADSAGLACVIALAARARRTGGRLAVVGWPEGLRALAEVSGVSDVLASAPPAAQS